jgi:adenosylcobinamide kinase/adenosylcobinamide-phosphate guanylyltransferase
VPATSIEFVLGGARSGKTRHALDLAEACGLRPVYVATGTAFDDEMRDRIARHREERGPQWSTVEEPIDLASVIARDASAGRVLLVDCLTLWLNNLMFAERDIAVASAGLCAALAASAGPLILVSNEVGLGIVPENALARAFRDAQGRLNQAVAKIATRVTFVAAGLPLVLKG